MTTSTELGRPRLFGTAEIDELLVPVTGAEPDERGPAIAGRYGRLWNVPVRLVHVRRGDDDVSPTELAAAVAMLTSAHPELEVEAVEVDGDDVAAAVLAAAGDRSLIVLASDQGSQWFERGSVGEALVQQSSQPVLLCGPLCQSPPVGTSVAVALDGSTRAEAAIDPALAVAAATDARVSLVTVVDTATVSTVAELRERGEAVSESGYLRTVVERLEDEEASNVGWEIVHGDDPVAGLISFVRHHGASLLVAATHGDTGIAKRLFGSVAFGLVERGPVPVLMIRPGDIEAPMALTV